MRRVATLCLECGKPTRHGPRCEAHAHLAPRSTQRRDYSARPSPADRGYGAAHQRERRRWACILESAGSLPCPYCGEPVQHGTRWDLAHRIDGDPTAGYLGPSHHRCNSLRQRRPKRPKRPT